MTTEHTLASLNTASGLHSQKISKSFVLSPAGERKDGDRVVLTGINFSLGRSEIVGLVGKTGVGKTTLGKIVGGVFRPDSGSVCLGDHDIRTFEGSDHQLLRRMIRYVPQNPDAVLSSTITVQAAFDEARAVCRLPKQEMELWSAMLLDRPLFELAWLHRQFGELSLGERRRIVNLRSLLTCPAYIVMDEPFNGLDLSTRGAMLDLLRSAAEKIEMGMLIVSHDVTALHEICDKILLLDKDGLEPYQPE
ncbi:MAG: ATP-binding cassette domain-containing protein [bacterium]|nr:ATP-binding cassette domain-containing protein [bacterium]